MFFEQFVLNLERLSNVSLVVCGRRYNRRNPRQLLKEMFIDVFGTPRGHPKSKAFVDRSMTFFYADNKVRLRLRLWLSSY